MFEQSLYDTEPVATPLEDGDLFHNYELRNWELSPRLYKILGISAFANILTILIVAQTSLLTMKGCDSPLVGRVCQVLDTVYVGTMLFGTDRQYVDAAYDKTDLADSDITFVDVSNAAPQLYYPSDYMKYSDPDKYAMMQQQASDPLLSSGFPPGFPVTRPSTGRSLLDTAPVLPKHNDDVIDGTLPTFGESNGSSIASTGTGKHPRGGHKPADNTTAENKTPDPTPTPLTSDTVNAVEINKKPLTDFADDVAAKWDAKDVDLNQNFTIVLNGVLTKEGRLDKTKSKFDVSKQKGDPKMINVGKAALEALGESGYLTYLQLLGVDKVNATLIQDDKTITVVITSSQKTPERAKTVADGLQGAIMLGKLKTNNPSDERTLLDGATVTSDGKSFVLNFVIPKPIAQEMITRKLKEAQAKKAQPQPNGNAASKPVDNTGQK